MKNIKQNIQKTLALILILSFFAPSLAPKKAHAFLGIADTGDAVLGAILSNDMFDNTKDTVSQIKDLISAGMRLSQDKSAAKDLDKQIKNYDAATFAKNASAESLEKTGEAVMKNTGTSKEPSTNVFTKGGQIVVNYANFLDKLSINEIKKGIANLQLSVNTSPYNSDIYKSISDFTKNTSDTALGKIINFALPHIVKDEICNSPELKDVIKNGEPETFILPKKAVTNVDIEKLCNTSLQKPPKEAAKAQATFIGLAKEGYGGIRTKIALADPSNTPSGVIALTISTILEQKDKNVDAAAKQTEATGMFLGDQKCIDKDGKEVKYDPTNTKQYCYQQVSTTEESGAVLKEKVSAAAESPYISILARADAIHNKLKNGTLIPKLWDYVSKLLHKNKKDISDIVSDEEDNYYRELSSALSSIQEIQGVQEGLWASTEEGSREYKYGSEKFTSADLEITLDIYQKIREVNTQKFNTYTYTYLLLKNSVANSVIAVRDAKKEAIDANSRWFGLGSLFKKGKETRKAVTNKSEAAKKLTISLVNLTSATRNLIKEMAKNNYREQQIEKLLLEFRNTKDVDTEDNQEALDQALTGAYTEKDYEFLLNDWSYIPEYSEINNDPYTAVTKDASYYIPTRDEIEGPYTENLLRYLRVRSYLMFRDSLDAAVGIRTLADFRKRTDNSILKVSPQETFEAYGIKTLDRLNPNLPRPSRETTAIVDADISKTYSELSYCDQTKLGICKEDERKILLGILADEEIFESTEAEEEDAFKESCLDPEGSVRKLCSQNMPSDPDFTDVCSSETAIQSSIATVKVECAKKGYMAATTTPTY